MPKVVCGKPRKFDTIHLVVKGKLQLLLVLMLLVKQFIQWSYTVLQGRSTPFRGGRAGADTGFMKGGGGGGGGGGGTIY